MTHLKMLHIMFVHHHSMAHSWVVDRRDGLQIWRVAVKY